MALAILPFVVPKELKYGQFCMDRNTVFLEGLTADGRVAHVIQHSRMPVSCPLNKEKLERLHLEKVRFDHLIRLGSLLFDTVERGNDPPDFQVHVDSHRVVGLDVSALAWSESRNACRLFDIFVKRIEASKPLLTNISETAVGVWFNLGQDLPPKRTDPEAADNLIEALGKLQLDRPRMKQLSAEIVSNGFPGHFPDWYPVRGLPNKLEDGLPSNTYSTGYDPEPVSTKDGI